jgi:hypothetical protein
MSRDVSDLRASKLCGGGTKSKTEHVVLLAILEYSEFITQNNGTFANFLTRHIEY